MTLSLYNPMMDSASALERPNHVRVADICYLPMARWYLYLVAIMN